MRETLHKIHRWIGLVLCIPLVTLGLSGSLLVFQHQFHLGEAHYHLAQGAPHSMSAIIAAASAAAPEGFLPTMLHAPSAPDMPATVFLAQKQHKTPGAEGHGRRVQMLIDPVSLAILDSDASNGLMQKVALFHSSLLMRDYGGRNVVGWLGVAMLLFGISGLTLRWPKRRRWLQAFTIRHGAQGFQLYRDLHGAAGLWALAVFMTVSFSGVYLAFPQVINAVIGSIFPMRDLRAPPDARIEPMKHTAPMTVDDAIALAEKSVENTKLASVMLPAKPDQPYRITLERTGDKDGAPTSSVFINPWTQKVIDIRDPKDYSAGETIISWQHTLHAGQGLGWIWRILVFTLGFMPLLFSFTGVSMWLMKRRKKSHARKQAKQPL